MKTLFQALTLVAGFPLMAQAQGRAAPPTPAPAANPGAHVFSSPSASLISFEGFIEVQRAGASQRQRITSAPLDLQAGDKVLTYRKGQAVLQFKDGSQVCLEPFTTFVVEEVSPGRISLHLETGILRALVAKLRSRQFQVRTAVAVASVRGTEFIVEVGKRMDTTLRVKEGQVAFKDLFGNERLFKAGESGEVSRDGLLRSERPGQERRGRKEEGKQSKVESEHLKQALEREVGFQVGREAIETAAAFEMKNAVYQAGKALVDAFGQRVRLEQYITRPDPSSFKYVALNFRQNRLDFGAFEVTANKPLPDDLSQAGNLWFSPGSTPPPFYAVKERVIMSNSQDSYVQLGVDGQSVQSTFDPNAANCGSAGCNFSSGRATFYSTIFGNTYEFINGDPTTLNNIWAGASRPLDATGMMAHLQPVQIAVKDVANPAGAALATYWEDTFLVTNPANRSGKGFIDDFSMPDPSLAHFIQTRYYSNFQEPVGNTNGILDFGEAATYSGCQYGDCSKTVFLNKQGRMNGTVFTAFATKDTQEAAQNVTIFSDKNGTGAPGGSNPTLGQPITDPNDSRLFAFVTQNYRDYLQTDNYVIDDFGNIFNFNNLSSFGSASSENAISSAFEKLNFEQVLTSSVFPGRKIDLVIAPNLFLESGVQPAQ